jgi:ABC-2 type transport system ATP-binding protein
MIEVRDLTKNYGDFQAVQNISFSISVDHGITALLGPNGAGKTTTMRLITGYLKPSAGDALVGGLSVSDEKNRVEIKKQIGYLPETTPLYPEMLVSEYLEFMGRARGLDDAALDARARIMIDQLELGSHLYSPIGILSKGFRQRVALAGTLIHDPQYIILDEPTSGLDPNQISHIRSIIRELGKKRTLILSTHILQEVEDICDRVIIVSRGRIAADQSAASLRQAGQTCSLVAKGAGAGERLKDCKVIKSFRVESRSDLPEGYSAFVCDLTENKPEDLFAFAAQQGWQVRELSPAARSLGDVFRELTA